MRIHGQCRSLIIAAFVLMARSSQAQGTLLGETRNEVVETLRLYCRNYNEYPSGYSNDTMRAAVIEIGDTVLYRIPGDDGAEYRFVFSAETCMVVFMKFTCLSCLQTTYRKWFFKGRWRVDDSGYFYRVKDPARAAISRVKDFPYLYELELLRLNAPPSHEVVSKMRKVKKKRIGTRVYPLKGNWSP